MFILVGFTRHANALLLTQLQALSSGVGGRVVLASSDAFCAGQLIVDAVTEAFAGEVGPAVPLYCPESRVKSSEGCTLLYISSTSWIKSAERHVLPSAEKVTIPYPSLVGK